MDRNGYNVSIFPTFKCKCYVCGGLTETARHEVYMGADRQNAKKYGLWINVCPPCHRAIHTDSNGKFYYLKEEGQTEFEKHYSREKFYAVFGRWYK